VWPQRKLTQADCLTDPSVGCVTLQGGKCNFKLRTLGILHILALGALGPGLEFGI